MTTEEFIDDLEKNICCRLQPSPIHGIGIFAIRDIPKGMNPFQGCRTTTWRKTPLKDIVANRKIHREVKKFLRDICVVRGDMIYVPNHSLNAIDISYFLNNSDKPNITVLENGDKFVTSRRVRKGEELLSDYKTYPSE